MKPQKKSFNLYIMVGALSIMLFVGVVVYFTVFLNSNEINFTLVDNSTGDANVKIRDSYGLRTNVLILIDNNQADYCYATVWFNEQQTTGTLKIELYLESVTRRTSVDIGLLGDTGLLYEWSNFTGSMLSSEWITITIEYDNTYNRGSLYINGDMLGSQHNFVSNPDYITGFYLRTNPTGVISAYFDIINFL